MSWLKKKKKKIWQFGLLSSKKFLKSNPGGLKLYNVYVTDSSYS